MGYFDPACLKMLPTVPFGISFLGWGTVTIPFLVGCLKWWWLPLVRTNCHPSFCNISINALDLTFQKYNKIDI